MSQDVFLLNACTDRHDWRYCKKSAVPQGQALVTPWTPPAFGMGTQQKPSSVWDKAVSQPKESSTFPFPNNLKFQDMSEGVGLTPVPPEGWAFWDSNLREVNLKTEVQVHHTFGVVYSVQGWTKLYFPSPEDSSTPWDLAQWCIRLLKTEAGMNFCLAQAVWNIQPQTRDPGTPGCPFMQVCPWTRAHSGASTALAPQCSTTSTQPTQLALALL